MKVVLCHGKFDILHIGHVLHLQQAREFGDRLLVSITAGKFIQREGRPVFTDKERMDMLWSLRVVDFVFLCDEPTGVTAIRTFRPNFYAKGLDYAEKGINEAETQACLDVRATIVFTNTQKFSSGALVRYLK